MLIIYFKYILISTSIKLQNTQGPQPLKCFPLAPDLYFITETHYPHCQNT